MGRSLSKVQIEVLSIIADGSHYEPGKIWQHHSSYDYSGHLGLLNFGRTMDALARRGLVERDDHGYTITPAGVAVVKPLALFDAVLTARLVDVPDRCPACGADLTRPHALREERITVAIAPTHLGSTPLETTRDGVDVIDDSVAPNAWHCVCGHRLARGAFRIAAGEQGPAIAAVER